MNTSDNSALGSSMQVNENLDLQALAAPPIDSPSSVFGPMDATSMSSARAAALGTTALNFGPGQSAFNEQLDTRSAVATDMALMQSI